MRIIAGKLKGRQFDSPRGFRTHPMSEKMRGALFNILGDLSGLSVLDAFTGSGALAFEAVSRGAKRVTAMDVDKGAITTAVNSAKALGLADSVKLTQVNVASWLKTQPNEQFDIVICDPPYDDIQPKLLDKLGERVLKGGVLALSLPPGSVYEPSAGLEKLHAKVYGDGTLVFYRKID